MSSYQRRNITARSFDVLERHLGQAVFAASIALLASAVPQFGTVPNTCPLDGLVISLVSPLSASDHLPFI